MFLRHYISAILVRIPEGFIDFEEIITYLNKLIGEAKYNVMVNDEKITKF
ncbi:MAG: hypothetical protein FWE14_10435 [Lachnospiraceae bacterium]|nr:hypothetical protein [Lachnospiraceae bacterium]